MSEMKKNPRREEADVKDCWRLEDLYPSDADWEKDLLEIRRQLESFAGYAGRLGESSGTLLLALQEQDAISLRMERLYVYASQKSHQDMGNARWQDMADRAQAQMAQAGERLSFVEPELLAISGEVWERYLKEEPRLALYERLIDRKSVV